jgi:hypothetical protein
MRKQRNYIFTDYRSASSGGALFPGAKWGICFFFADTPAFARQAVKRKSAWSHPAMDEL